MPQYKVYYLQKNGGILLLFCVFTRGCVWPRSGLGLDPQPGALSLLCHLISPHKGELVTWAQFGRL